MTQIESINVHLNRIEMKLDFCSKFGEEDLAAAFKENNS